MGRTGVGGKAGIPLRAEEGLTTRSRLTPIARAAPAPLRSPAFPALARSLRARARGWRGLRTGGRSIGRASRATAPRAGRSCANSARARSRSRSGAIARRALDLRVPLQEDFAAHPMRFRQRTRRPLSTGPDRARSTRARARSKSPRAAYPAAMYEALGSEKPAPYSDKAVQRNLRFIPGGARSAEAALVQARERLGVARQRADRSRERARALSLRLTERGGDCRARSPATPRWL